ncbi:hypothetical protein MKZ38_006066 [Zalerion maritima]|uniref:Uncharacterized protein n=1 Tax=Zalerion maritima TaxID=339359 RepID=A0AAD5RKK4_9PEZI|nr:hypothetical protein MKZ38_006066 [Zalerion maritima]
MERTKMHPVSALNLAGTILQLIDSGSKFARLAYRLYRSRADTSQVEYGDLRTTATPSSNDTEKSLGTLAQECGKTAAHLLAILQKVKPGELGRKRDALQAALRLILKEDEIKALQDNLSSYRSQLNLHLPRSIREHVSRSAEQQAQTLKNLGVIEGVAAQTGGMTASIPCYLVSVRCGSGDHPAEIRALQKELVGKIYDSETEEERQDGGFRLDDMKMSESDYRDA